MVVRLFLALLTVVISTPVYADCPVVKKSAAHDCCRKTKNCPHPTPVDAQPCFDCVADVRTTAIATAQPAVISTAAILPEQSSFTAVDSIPADPFAPLTDNSSTYLRIGVLRL
ncbi:MAG: hypothetical protein ABIR70_07455 [Bryobacteraceae bacterium]